MYLHALSLGKGPGDKILATERAGIAGRRPSPFSPQGGEKMTNYEVMFIIDPTLEDEKKEATIEAVKEIIASEGEVGKVDVWGMRKLAYPIQKKTEGYYVVIEFKAQPTLPRELDRRLKISDNVMRHLIDNKDQK